MKGAIVFIVVFLILLAATFAYTELPPGNMISDSINVDPTVVWNGILVRTLTSAIFNGVIYGIIAWIIFTLAARSRKPKTKQ